MVKQCWMSTPPPVLPEKAFGHRLRQLPLLCTETLAYAAIRGLLLSSSVLSYRQRRVGASHKHRHPEAPSGHLVSVATIRNG